MERSDTITRYTDGSTTVILRYPSRALSDQFYGYPDQHAQLRQEICDYLAASPDRFAGFVDIEKPFDDYVHTMRQNGTYGGHLELSAFASLKRKEIKIVQPGLVYRVTGHDDSPEAIAERDTLERQREAIQGNLPSGSERPPASAREIRRRKRVESRGSRVASTEPTESAPEGSASAHTSLNTPVKDEAETFECPEAFGPLYIAYVYPSPLNTIAVESRKLISLHFPATAIIIGNITHPSATLTVRTLDCLASMSVTSPSQPKKPIRRQKARVELPTAKRATATTSSTTPALRSTRSLSCDQCLVIR